MIKKKKTPKEYQAQLTIEDRANFAMSRMNHRDLKKSCISRGMPFDEVLGSSHHELASFFLKNYEMGENPALLTEYDAYLESQLDPEMRKLLNHPSLKYGFVTDEKISEHASNKLQNSSAEGKPKTIVQKDIKPKTETNQNTGIRKGTKKDLTYQLCDEKIPVDKVIKEVKTKFPDAQEKSIKIWYSRRAKENKTNKNK